MTTEMSEGPGRFPVTRWSLVARAGGDDPARRLEAMEELLRRYLPALQAHLVIQKRLPPEQADDLIQSFITDKIIQGQLLEQADPQRGKFRTVLLTALDRCIISEFRKQNAQKRAPEAGFVSLDAEAVQVAAPGGGSAAFDLEWARQIIAEALRRVQAECDATGRAAFWQLFELRVVRPMLEGAEPPPYDELVRRFGFQSPTQASNALLTAKRMFARFLHEVVAEYAGDETLADAELNELRMILAGAGA
jgi:RNA polymerase sigma-70 factor (ECF subfamily)